MVAAKWQLIPVLEEGERKCSGLGAGALLGGWAAASKGRSQGCPYTARPDLEQVFALFADSIWKALLWKEDLQGKVAVADFWNFISMLTLQSNWNLFG